MEALELLVEEASGLGVLKRVARKVRLRLAREFINKIDALTRRNDALTLTINRMSDVYEHLLEQLDAKDARIAELKAQLSDRGRADENRAGVDGLDGDGKP